VIGVEVVIRNCLSVYLALLSEYGASKIWGHDLDLLGSRDVIGHVSIWLAVVDFLWVVHSDHASIWHRYGDAVWSSSKKALPVFQTSSL